MKKRIDQVITFIREARDDSENTAERILFFIAFLVIGIGIIVPIITIITVTFTFPKIMIPLIIGIALAWKGYKQL